MSKGVQGFFKRGEAKAVFQMDGNDDYDIEEFIILVIDGNRVSKWSFRIEVGMGSKLQYLFFVLVVILLTSSLLIYLNFSIVTVIEIQNEENFSKPGLNRRRPLIPTP